MRRKSIVVTGASGLLGGQVVRDLRADWEVHAIVRTPPSAQQVGVNYHVLDLGGNWSPTSLPNDIDAVLHLAQSSRFRDFPQEALDVFRVNVESTAILLDYAHRAGASRFLLASSGGVYGSGGKPFVETDTFAPASKLGYYLSSKVNSELLAQSYAALMQVVILRFFFIYGSGQHRTMLIPRLMDNVAAGRSVSIQGDDGIRVNPIHVSDASRAVLRALALDGNATFNIAGSQVVSLRELCREIETIVGRPAIFQQANGAPMDLVANIDAMCGRLCAPAVSLDFGLRDLLA